MPRQRVLLRRAMIVFPVHFLGRVPIPWAHSHTWLVPERLDRHFCSEVANVTYRVGSISSSGRRSTAAEAGSTLT